MHAVIFDLDGTLVDSLDDIAAALAHVLEARGLPAPPRAEVAEMVGDGARSLVLRALGRESARIDEVFAAYRAHYEANLIVHTRAFEGVDALLLELARRMVPTAVLSNKPHAMTDEVVARIFPEHPFVAVCGEREGVPRKPDPEAALELLPVLGVEPGDVLFVGDSEVDLETARRAGMVGVAVSWGLRAPATLAPLARHLLARPVDLLGLLAR